MRLTELHLKAFGPFTDHVLHFGSGGQRLVLVHGLNEAGKSSALRAIAGLRFGIDDRSDDRFVHDYPKMRIGGVFTDAQGQAYSLMRRKGRGVTLRFADFASGVELPDAVPGAVNQLLTGGLALKDYQSMFGLDHDSLRKGGQALAKGEGEIGAALFEASSGAHDVQKILAELDASAKKFFMPGANAKNARINQALADYKQQLDHYKLAQIKPARWEAADRARRDAQAALDAAKRGLLQLDEQLSLTRELMAVSPLLAALAHANTVSDSLAQQALLDENAASQRAAAQAGLSDAAADADLHSSAIRAHRASLAQLQLDPSVLAVAQAVSRLAAASASVSQLLSQIASAGADATHRQQAVDALAGQIDAAAPQAALLAQAQSPAFHAQVGAAVAELAQAEAALAQHLSQAPQGMPARPAMPSAFPDAAAQAELRIALAEAAKSSATLDALARLPAAIGQAQRLASSRLLDTGLPSEAAARQVRPLLDYAIDDASRRNTALASERHEKTRRIDEARQALAQQQAAIHALLAHGPVPTHEEVNSARLARQTGWSWVRKMYIDKAGGQPGPAGDTSALDAFAQGQPLPARYEDAVATADRLVDLLASDTGRVTRLEAARRQFAQLTGDVAQHQAGLQQIDARQAALDADWQQTLAAAGIAAMPPGQLRDWQARLAQALAAFDSLQALVDDHAAARAAEQALTQRLRLALARVGGHGKPAADDANGREASRQRSLMDFDENRDAEADAPVQLATWIAMADDALRQIQLRIEDDARAAGQAQQLQRQLDSHATAQQELTAQLGQARARFAACLASLYLPPGAGAATAKARLAEFSQLASAQAALYDAQTRQASYSAALGVYTDAAAGIAAALGEPAPASLLLAAERWAARLAAAVAQQSRAALLQQQLATAEQALASSQSRAVQHQATLARLCQAAGVGLPAELPAAEENARRKRQALRDSQAASDQLAQASRKTSSALQQLLGARSAEQLRHEEAELAQQRVALDGALEQARAADEAARRELASLDALDAAASAQDAMSSAAATIRQTLPLFVRTRLAHALLHEAVRRFKERSQAPMLKSASLFFAQLTGGEFTGLVHDDAHEKPVIAARRASGQQAAVEAFSEGTRDQLYLALRLAALQLQRERGVDLPLVLDDVLMTSDDHRAGCILQALHAFSSNSQVIVFTHHRHIADLAAKSLPADALAVVELTRARAAAPL